MNNKIDVSIVLAVYNEEESIARELEIIKGAMSKSKYNYEIIVVDDGSTDNTANILKGAEGIMLIRNRRNKGSGGSRKIGTIAARGRIVVWTDSDLTYPNHLIPQLAEALEKSNCRQIVGSRMSEKGTWKLLRSPAKYVLKNLASFLTKTEIPDLNSGFRAFYTQDGLKLIHLIPDGFSCVSTMTLSFLCNDMDVGYMAIEYKKRVGKSKFHPLRDSYAYFLQIIRMVTYFQPLRVFVPLSAGIFMFTLVKNIIDLAVTKDTQQTDIVGYFISFIIFAIGLLADLIVAYNKRTTLLSKEDLS